MESVQKIIFNKEPIYIQSIGTYNGEKGIMFQLHDSSLWVLESKHFSRSDVLNTIVFFRKALSKININENYGFPITRLKYFEILEHLEKVDILSFQVEHRYFVKLVVEGGTTFVEYFLKTVAGEEDGPLVKFRKLNSEDEKGIVSQRVSIDS